MARATIEDVAKRAGVTKSTVSHALSGKRPVSGGTRRRIDEAIAALGYRPNPVAQRLAAGRSGAIGFVYPLTGQEPEGSLAGILAAVSGVVSPAGFALVLFAQPHTHAEELQPCLESGLLDGVILAQMQMEDARVRALREAGLPFVMMGRTADNGGSSFVDVDVDAAVEECVGRLVELGHARIAFLHREARESAEASRALQAYERACARRRLRIHAPPCLHTPADARTVATSALNQWPDVTALIVSGDLAAWGAYQAAQDLARDIPDDLSLVCLGKTRASSMLPFEPAAVDLRPVRQAEQAVAMLLDLLGDTGNGERQVLLEPCWLSGETLAPPAHQ
jgi:DNA-binding LacI/PurR family transcriptional regulator